MTAQRSKPSVPCNGKHRIVDFVRSNLVDSELDSLYLLVQDARATSAGTSCRASCSRTGFPRTPGTQRVRAGVRQPMAA